MTFSLSECPGQGDFPNEVGREQYLFLRNVCFLILWSYDPNFS